MMPPEDESTDSTEENIDAQDKTITSTSNVTGSSMSAKEIEQTTDTTGTDTATTDSTDISAATSELTSTSTSEETTTSSETATSTDSTTTTDSTEATTDSTEIAEADTTFDVDTIFTSGTFEIAGGGGNPDSIFQGEINLAQMKMTRDEGSWSPEFWQASGSLGIDLNGLDIGGTVDAAFYRAGRTVPGTVLTLPDIGSSNDGSVPMIHRNRFQ